MNGLIRIEWYRINMLVQIYIINRKKVHTYTKYSLLLETINSNNSLDNFEIAHCPKFSVGINEIV